MAGFTYRQLYTTWESTPPHLIYSTEDCGPQSGLDASEGEPGRRSVVIEYAYVAVPVMIIL
jgi:hypothetical protein